MKKFFIIIKILVITFLFSSCATMFSGSKQQMAFSSEPSGAKVEHKGVIIGYTPFFEKIKRKKSASFIFSKENYENVVVVKNGKFNTVTLWNLFWFCGFPVALAIDYATGAAWKYPNNQVFAQLTPKGGIRPATEGVVAQNPQPTTSNKPQQNNMQQQSKSEVDVNIPVTNAVNDKTFVAIIANENYQRESNVDFAKNDGEMFMKYCMQTLGIPEKNIRFAADATLNNIRAEVNWLSKIADAFSGEATIIFYYAGHGVPDESSKSAYLLPIDGYGSDIQTGYKIEDLYHKLGSMPAKKIIVFMDACFSGSQRGSDMLASARGVAIKANTGKPTGNMIVFSASQGDETAFPFYEKGHGMFTFFLLKKLQESKGEATLGELSEFIATNVRQQSIINNNKSQTPNVTPSSDIGEKWKGMKLK